MNEKPNKRGRKSKSVNFKKTDSVLSHFNLEETLILKLPISLDKILNIIPQRLGIEGILMGAPNKLQAINDNHSNLFLNNVKQKPLKENIETPEIYNTLDSLGNHETTYIYNKTPLPVVLDNENVKRIKFCKTDVACWWCCHRFDDFPVSAPLRYNSETDMFHTVGVFCSFNCAKSYSSTNKVYSAYDSLLYKKIKGQLKSIKKAPPKTVLKMFGGPLTIEEYRKTFDTLSTIKVNKYPMIFIPSQVEYHKVNKLVQDSMSKINISKSSSNTLSSKTISGAQQRLTKNKKDMKNDNNTLMDIMGIKIK